MITRRVSEIIRLALTVSQIQNADALSWRDKVDMINQSYVTLYGDLNNNGDLYYSKEAVFEPVLIDRERNSLRLPKDFWKLLLIGYRSSFGGIVPIERAPNAGQYFSGYRIINNEIFFNNFFAPGPLVIRYIPQPQSLSYPRTGHRIAGKAAQAAYDSQENVIVLAGTGGFRVLDNSRGQSLNRDVEGSFILALSHGIIYIVKETGIYCFDYSLNLVSSYEGSFDLYAHAIGWEQGIIVRSGGIVMRYVSGGTPETYLDYWNFMDGSINRSITAGVETFVYTGGGEVRDITEIFNGADSFVIADPFIYINKQGSAKVYEDFMPADIAPAPVGRGSRKGIVLAAEAGNETGYGVIFNDFYSGLNLLGFASDTVLNYPQNVFFDWLSADLAVKFRIALDIPSGELPALEADYYDTLMKGLSRDAYMSQRINNVYGKGFI